MIINKELSKEARHLGIYIHVPFCLSKCKYCGFYSGASEDKKAYEDYLSNTLEDIAAYGEIYGGKVDTVFFGGGTPSILPYGYIGRILAALRENFSFDEYVEITIEANPKTLNEESLRAYRTYGVNRLSIGCQSFDDNMLKFIGRAHDSNDIYETVKLARAAGFDNINLDLIFGLPGQSLKVWKDSLKAAISLKPEHLSLYSLQLEEGTELFNMFQREEFDQLSDEEDRAMYHFAMDYLENLGYDHYEISNWAKDGLKCKHNLKYWDLSDYLGIGPSASSYMDGIRFAEEPGYEYHENSLKDKASEFAFTSLRTRAGIDKKLFCQRVGAEFDQIFAELKGELAELEAGGYIEQSKGHIKLTGKGIDISNKIMALFV